MRTATLSVVTLVLLATSVQAQKQVPKPAHGETLAIGTIDKIDASIITVNRLKGGEPLTFKFARDCVYRVDGLTVERTKIKRGMKVVIEGFAPTREAERVLAFDRDPLP